MKLTLNKIIILTILIGISSIFAAAQDKQIDSLSKMAVSAFQKKDYAEASRQYEQLLQLNPSSTTYYNLGVCYSKIERNTDAILAYERALLLDPSLPEARQNLHLAYAATKDNLGDGRSVLWLDNLCYALQINTISYISYTLFAILIGLILIFWSYRRRQAYSTGKYYFFAACFIGVCWLFSLAIIGHQIYYHNQNSLRAIINQTQELKPTPTGQGNTITTLHEGTAVFMIGQPLGHFQEVSLPDGRTGWLPTPAFTPVVLSTIEVD